jgi:hypothetical protein
MPLLADALNVLEPGDVGGARPKRFLVGVPKASRKQPEYLVAALCKAIRPSGSHSSRRKEPLAGTCSL